MNDQWIRIGNIAQENDALDLCERDQDIFVLRIVGMGGVGEGR